jgi:3-oxoadipate enol-lactonase
MRGASVTDELLHFTPPEGPDGADLLVLGHSLGTGAVLWSDVVPLLTAAFRVVLWELPGHGESPAPTGPYTVGDLSDAVVEHVDRLGVETFSAAGVSLSGVVALDLVDRYPERVCAAVVISAGARVDAPSFWHDRAQSVRASGTGVLVQASSQRWFASRTRSEAPHRIDSLLDALRTTDDGGYARGAEALAAFDIAERLPGIEPPVLAIAGEYDEAVPEARSRDIAEAVQRGRMVRIPDAAHAAPLEQPRLVAEALTEFLAGVGSR